MGLETDTIHHGDAFDVLPELPSDSIHACVTDPPYGLAFMGRDWDDFEPKEYQAWSERWARAVKRVLKPGGHMLAFSGNRTHHRLFAGVEDAGFEIRDTITWHYGSGFPKALDVSKAIDKQADAEREVVAENPSGRSYAAEKRTEGRSQSGRTIHAPITAPATNAAKQWDGWKTALKPATEYVVMARKPFDGTVAENVQTHGTGALNIGECRVGSDELEYTVTDQRGGHVGGDNSRQSGPVEVEGRYPSNVVFDDEEADRLDRRVGTLESGSRSAGTYDTADGDVYGSFDESQRPALSGSRGGPSRYFYTSKASRSERTHDDTIANTHPTVKPIDLMEWLIKLVTAEGQIVLDPFVGSGTTAVAAKRLNRQFVAIEREAEYHSLAQARAGLTPDDPSVVRDDDAQQGFDAFTEDA